MRSISLSWNQALKLAGEKIRREQVGSVPTFCPFARTKSPSGKYALVCLQV